MNLGYRQIMDYSELSLKMLNEQLEAIWYLLLKGNGSGGADNG
jgi:hypothetical protein